MIHVDAFKFDTDEGGFTLELWLDEDPVLDNRGRVVLDIHSVAIELLDAAEKEIGPYRAERDAALHSVKVQGGDPLDEQPWPGESAMDYYQRTGDDEPLRDMADYLRKAEREGA